MAWQKNAINLEKKSIGFIFPLPWSCIQSQTFPLSINVEESLDLSFELKFSEPIRMKFIAQTAQNEVLHLGFLHFLCNINMKKKR